MLFSVQGTRNTGKSIANKNTANPTAMLLASCLLLDHLKLHGYASMIRKAILSTITDSQVRFDQCYMQFVGGIQLLLLCPALYFDITLNMLSPLCSSCTLLIWEVRAPHLKWSNPSWMQSRTVDLAHRDTRNQMTVRLHLSL